LNGSLRFCENQLKVSNIEGEVVLTSGVYSGCARCAAHTLWNWKWRGILQIVHSRQNHKNSYKDTYVLSSLKVFAICIYLTALVFEETFAQTAFAVVSCELRCSRAEW